MSIFINKILNEDLQYTPDKINEFIQQAIKISGDGEAIYQSLFEQVKTISIEEGLTNLEGINVLKEKIRNLVQILGKKEDYFQNALNVSDNESLDDAVQKITSIYFKASNLDFFIDEYINVIEKWKTKL